MIQLLLLAAATAVQSCWSLYDAALSHSASAAHPPYVTYNEHILIKVDGARLLYSSASVAYRDDGLARVSDERFDFRPYLTFRQEPGPPEIGPYGKGREMWLPAASGLPVIADVRAAGRVTCRVAGEEAYKTHDTYHLSFTGAPADRPHLEDLWIDTRSHDIWKLVVSGPVPLNNGDGNPIGLADFQVELAYIGPHLIVDHVVWTYRQHEFSQYSNYFGEYVFDSFDFPATLPDWYFAVSQHTVIK